MKKVICLLLTVFLIIVSVIPSFAITVYGNVSPSTSQVIILTDAMLNDPGFDSRAPWVALRQGEYDYYIYYNIDFDGESANYIRYHQTGSGYQSVWLIDYGNTYSFSFPLTSYTMVGNIEGTLYSETYNNYKNSYISNFFLIFLFFVVTFFVFRIRKREISL